MWEQLKLCDGVLYRDFYHDGSKHGVKFRKMVVPKALREDIFDRAHCTVTWCTMYYIRTAIPWNQHFVEITSIIYPP